MNDNFIFETDVTKFNGYERTLAECHMINFGKIICSKKWKDVIEVEDVCYLIESGDLVI